MKGITLHETDRNIFFAADWITVDEPSDVKVMLSY